MPYGACMMVVAAMATERVNGDPAHHHAQRLAAAVDSFAKCVDRSFQPLGPPLPDWAGCLNIMFGGLSVLEYQRYVSAAEFGAQFTENLTGATAASTSVR